MLAFGKDDMAQFEDQKVLIVERFDRKFASDKSWIIRLPQEDMCQAKGLSPLLSTVWHGWWFEGGKRCAIPPYENTRL